LHIAQKELNDNDLKGERFVFLKEVSKRRERELFLE